MKKQTFLILIFGLIIYNFSYAQESESKIEIDSYHFPEPTIEKVIEWLDMSTNQWENELKGNFFQRGVSENCVYLGTSGKISKAILTYKKCPGPILSFDWLDLTNSRGTKFDKIVEELEPYFSSYRNGIPVYSFLHNEFKYEFTVSRESNQELIFAYKLRQ